MYLMLHVVLNSALGTEMDIQDAYIFLDLKYFMILKGIKYSQIAKILGRTN